MFFTQQSHAIGGQANAITCGIFAMHCDMTAVSLRVSMQAYTGTVFERF